jgi:Molybdopterin-binding domain of aldehyde dehydrogenase
VSNLFYTNPMRPESPLLAFCLLWMLRQRLNSVRDEGVESKHWHASELCAVFEGCGVAGELVMQVLNRLYERRLIEALDPNVKHIGVGDRVAIKDSGLAHIELVLNSSTYIEQTALTTGVNELFTRDEMRRNNYPQKMGDVRNAFVRYLLKIDAGRVTIPTTKVYEQIGLARRQIEGMVSPRRGSRAQLSRKRSQSASRVVCAVDCGTSINPDVITAQMEGGIGFGLGAAL